MPVPKTKVESQLPARRMERGEARHCVFCYPSAPTALMNEQIAVSRWLPVSRKLFLAMTLRGRKGRVWPVSYPNR